MTALHRAGLVFLLFLDCRVGSNRDEGDDADTIVNRGLSACRAYFTRKCESEKAPDHFFKTSAKTSAICPATVVLDAPLHTVNLRHKAVRIGEPVPLCLC